MRRLIGTFALGVALSSTAIAQQRGDWVLAQWQGGSAWYPGVIESVSGNQITIRYDDGTRETRPLNQVRPYDWRVGTRVACQWTDGRWYNATITAMDSGGSQIDVLYEDGDRQRTNTGRCRVD